MSTPITPIQKVDGDTRFEVIDIQEKTDTRIEERTDEIAMQMQTDNTTHTAETPEISSRNVEQIQGLKTKYEPLLEALEEHKIITSKALITTIDQLVNTLSQNLPAILEQFEDRQLKELIIFVFESENDVLSQSLQEALDKATPNEHEKVCGGLRKVIESIDSQEYKIKACEYLIEFSRREDLNTNAHIKICGGLYEAIKSIDSQEFKIKACECLIEFSARKDLNSHQNLCAGLWKAIESIDYQEFKIKACECLMEFSTRKDLNTNAHENICGGLWLAIDKINSQEFKIKAFDCLMEFITQKNLKAIPDPHTHAHVCGSMRSVIHKVILQKMKIKALNILFEFSGLEYLNKDAQKYLYQGLECAIDYIRSQKEKSNVFWELVNFSKRLDLINENAIIIGNTIAYAYAYQYGLVSSRELQTYVMKPSDINRLVKIQLIRQLPEGKEAWINKCKIAIYMEEYCSSEQEPPAIVCTKISSFLDKIVREKELKQLYEFYGEIEFKTLLARYYARRFHRQDDLNMDKILFDTAICSPVEYGNVEDSEWSTIKCKLVSKYENMFPANDTSDLEEFWIKIMNTTEYKKDKHKTRSRVKAIVNYFCDCEDRETCQNLTLPMIAAVKSCSNPVLECIDKLELEYLIKSQIHDFSGLISYWNNMFKREIVKKISMGQDSGQEAISTFMLNQLELNQPLGLQLSNQSMLNQSYRVRTRKVSFLDTLKYTIKSIKEDEYINYFINNKKFVEQLKMQDAYLEIVSSEEYREALARIQEIQSSVDWENNFEFEVIGSGSGAMEKDMQKKAIRDALITILKREGFLK